MTDDDGFELIDKSEILSEPAHEPHANTERAIVKQSKQAKSLGEAESTADASSYLLVALTHVTALSAVAYQAAVIFASLAGQKVCAAYQRLCDPEGLAWISHSCQHSLSAAKPVAASVLAASQTALSRIAAFSDAALNRASARTDHIQGSIFHWPSPANTDAALELSMEDLGSLLALAKAWLRAVLELFVYECVLFGLFIQEMARGMVGCLKSHKVASS